MFCVYAGAAGIEKAVVYDVPLDDFAAKSGTRPWEALTADELKEIMSFRFDGDTCRVLVIPVEWTNRLHTYSRETIDSMFFSRNIFPGGSVADYYHEVSYGQLTIIGEVVEADPETPRLPRPAPGPSPSPLRPAVDQAPIESPVASASSPRRLAATRLCRHLWALVPTPRRQQPAGRTTTLLRGGARVDDMQVSHRRFEAHPFLRDVFHHRRPC